MAITSGIADSGTAFDALWGDFNHNGLTDFYTSNHASPAVLYEIQGNRVFKNVTEQFFSPNDLKGDKHDATRLDYNNDGNKELLVLGGGGRGVGIGPNSFLFAQKIL